ncbi:MAG: hypothetical protein WCK00_05280, partial [Deltaproteobacteria bacterium]
RLRSRRKMNLVSRAETSLDGLDLGAVWRIPAFFDVAPKCTSSKFNQNETPRIFKFVRGVFF